MKARLVGACLLAIGASATSANGAPVQGDVLSLTVAGAPEEVDRLADHLRPLLAPLNLTLSARRVSAIDQNVAHAPPPAPTGVRAQAWVDLLRPRQALVFFAGAEGQPVVVRTIPLSAGLDDVARAEITEILLAALEAPGVNRGEHATEAAVPPAPTGAVWRAAFALHATGESWAAEAPLVPALGVAAFFVRHVPSSAWSTAVWTAVRYRPPFATSASPVGVRIRGGAADAGVAVWRALGDRMALGLGGGMGADVRFSEPVAASGVILRRTERPRDLALFVRGLFALNVRLGLRASFITAVTIDGLPLQGRFVVDDGAGQAVVLSPWSVRPGLLFAVVMGSAH